MPVQGPTEGEAEIIARHFAYLERLVAERVVLMAGRTLAADENVFGIVIFVAASETEALQIMNDDPAVRHEPMRAQLYPYRVALWSRNGPPH
jgi:uncharacterized protein YciI